MTAAVRLYSIAICPFAQRTRMLLNLKGIPFELTEMGVHRRMPDWFLTINPLGQVPVIQHAGIVLNESSVINEYLEEVYPSPPALPSTPYKKALCRILIDFCNRQFVPQLYRLLMNQNRERDPLLIAEAQRTWHRVDDFLMRHNPEGTWLFDDDGFGMAELSYAGFLQRYCLNAYYRYFELPAGRGYLRVAKWRDAVLSHPLAVGSGMSEEAFIKYYYDYSLGYGNGEVPPDHQRSSFDPTISLDARPMPPRPTRAPQ